jgi:hypothetical protein
MLEESQLEYLISNKKFISKVTALRKNLRKDIYEMIEESSEEVEKIHKEKKKCVKKFKLFEGRNKIKRVKSFCFKIFHELLKNLVNFKEQKKTQKNSNKMQVKLRRYKTFICDISKFRNQVILNITMKELLYNFSFYEINELFINAKMEKRLTLNFLINSKWIDIIHLIQKKNFIFYKGEDVNLLHNQQYLTVSEIEEFLTYIHTGLLHYKERKTLSAEYLQIYSNFPSSSKTNGSEITKEVENFLTNFSIFI